MKKFSLSYAFSRSLGGITRTFVMSIATLLLLTCFLLVLGSWGLFGYNVDANLSSISGEGQAVVFLQSDCTDLEIDQMRALLDSYQQEGLLREYQYVSAADALNSELAKLEDYPQLYQSLQTGTNPYRPSFEISAASGEKLPELLTRIEGISLTRMDENGQGAAFVPVATITSHQSAADATEAILDTMRVGVMILLLVLLLICLFVLINTVRLAIFSQRHELAIMRYIGATRAFLTAPFLLHGVVLGFVSAAVAFFLQWLSYQKLTAYLSENYQMITLQSFDSVWYYLLAAFLFVGMFVGLIGGMLSTGRYLRETD